MMTPHSMLTFTASQQESLSISDHVFIEAGAGSGKTTILVERYLRILKEKPDVALHQIIAFTFTQKAALEMVLRVQDRLMRETAAFPRFRHLRENLRFARISTIHSFCSAMLRQHPLEANVDPEFATLEEDEALQLYCSAIDEVLEELSAAKDARLKRYLNEFNSISTLKNDLIAFRKKGGQGKDWAAWIDQTRRAIEQADTGEQHEKTAALMSLDLVTDLYHIFLLCLDAYTEKKQQLGKLDFDDLIGRTVGLFEAYPGIIDKVRQDIRYVMVDEFQDTDTLQWELIRHLSGNALSGQPAETEKNLFVVGDVKQSIYSFRGIQGDLFETVRGLYDNRLSGSRIVSLNDNFRTQRAVLEFINPFFDGLFGPALRYEYLTPNRSEEGGQVEFCILPGNPRNSREEIVCIIRWIQAFLAGHPSYSYGNMAILCRDKKRIEFIQSELAQAGIPAEIVSGVNIVKNEEIVDLIYLIRALLRPYDNIAWLRVLKSPFFGITNDGLFLLYDLTSSSILIERLKALSADETALNRFGETDRELLRQAATLIPKWLSQLQISPASVVAEQILEQAGVLMIYRQQSHGVQKTTRILQFLEKIRRIEGDSTVNQTDLLNLLDQLFDSAISIKPVAEPGRNAVSLMTIHSAKGLEFPVVIIPECGKPFHFGASDRLIIDAGLGVSLSYKTAFNGKESQNLLRRQMQEKLTAQTIEEEKRIFYVACTRAKDYLFIVGSEKPDKEEKEKETALTSYMDFIRRGVSSTVEEGRITFNFNPGSLSYRCYRSAEEIDDTGTGADKEFSENQQDVTTETESLQPFYIEPAFSQDRGPVLTLTSTNAIRLYRCAKQYRLQPLIEGLSYGDSHFTLPKIGVKPAEFGTIVHTLIEQVNRYGFDGKEERLRAIITPLRLTAETKQHLTAAADAHLTRFKPFYDHLHTADSISHEVPFSLKTGSLVIQGRIDTIVQEGGVYRIVDYKTDAISPEDTAQRAGRYQSQLKIYCLALKALFKLDYGRYEAVLYFTAPGIRQTVSFLKGELEEFEQRLQKRYQELLSRRFTPPQRDICEACPVFSIHARCPEEPFQ